VGASRDAQCSSVKFVGNKTVAKRLSPPRHASRVGSMGSV
jgi:hypothetical protein